MLKFKDGVPLKGLKPQMLNCVDICNDVFHKQGADCTITSTTDGKHMKKSLHYKGLAIDLRTWHLNDVESIAAKLRDALGKDFDVVVESDHIHVELDRP